MEPTSWNVEPAEPPAGRDAPRPAGGGSSSAGVDRTGIDPTGIDPTGIDPTEVDHPVVDHTAVAPSPLDPPAGAPGFAAPALPPPIAPLGAASAVGQPAPAPAAGTRGPGGPPGQMGPNNGHKPNRNARRALAAAAVVAILAAGGGFAAGRITDDSAPSNTLSGGTIPTQVANTGTTVAPPLSGNEAEPAAAVAKVLGPAMVQIVADDGLGSGFVYDKSGLILTAAHVVGSASKVKVQLADATVVTGKVLGADEGTDVAVVKISPRSDLTVAQLAVGIQVVTGQTAIAIGSPYGLYQTVTEGIISAVDRSIPTTSAQNEVPMLQTDAPINPGNSGGALADRRGRVIGINDSIYSGSSSDYGDAGNVGVGFAIPIDLAKSVADRIVAGKPIEPGFLGVTGQTSTGSQLGATIVTVEKESPAGAAGIEAGDLVVGLDGHQIASMSDLAAAVRTRQPGSKVVVTYERDGKQHQTTVTLGKGS